MQITKEAKKLLAEFLSRSAQVLFAMVLVGPFVTGNLKLKTTIVGIIGIAVTLTSAFLISLTIKEG